MAAWTPSMNPYPWNIPEIIVGVICPLGFVVVGTLGNFLSIAVLLFRTNRQSSTNIYLIFLCLMDIIALYQWNLSRPLQILSGDPQIMWGSSLALCKMNQFFPYYSLHTSAMFLTFVELDRAFLLRSRWYKNKIAQPKIAWIICALILIIFFGMDGFLFGLGFATSTYNNSTGRVETQISCYYSLDADFFNFYANTYITMHLVFMYIIPFCVIIICTILTVNKLFVREVSTNEQLARSAYRNRRISMMLLLMCLTYIVCTLPNRLCFTVFIYQILDHDYTDTVLVGSNSLVYLRNAMNVFFLYISVPGFRRDVHNLFLRCFGRAPNQMEETRQLQQTTMRNPHTQIKTISVRQI